MASSTESQKQILLPPADNSVSCRSTPAYSYTPLQPGTSEIRFVALQCGHWEAPIVCTLLHDFLDTAVAYEALSYTWGNPNVTEPILLNGSSFDITVNLDCALRHIRKARQSRIIWIDAICIDQRNLKERSEQVVRMQQIYTSAKSVIAWTGPSDQKNEVLHHILMTGSLWTQLPKHFVYSPVNLRSAGFDLSPAIWDATMKFLNRPYWSRMWIVQELASCGNPMSRENKCVIWCGLRQGTLKDICTIFLFLNHIANKTDVDLLDPQLSNELEPGQSIMKYGLTTAMGMISVLSRLHDESIEPPTIIELMLSSLQSFVASDVRDKLYATLLLKKPRAIQIEPDYKKPPMRVFIDFVRSFIFGYSDLSCMYGNRLVKNKFGPSWLPEINGHLSITVY